MTAYRDDPAAIKAMTRGDLLTFVMDRLLLGAGDFRLVVEQSGKIPRNWDWERHDTMCAAALAFERILAKGKDQVTRGVKVDPLVETIVDTVRSSLIQDAVSRAPIVVVDEPLAESGEVAA